LTGFKSFVDPTDLIIADGLTGVVGPNGCGKSNLLEALRWVMGENRPTAMRGGGMEDVIFAGAATRPARNYAEVSLVIDNSERLAPSGFNDTDQLDIVRRITRDAGSAFKTNGKDVRARDVQMLFADASTGAHSPALVRQGQISELINAKPKSRRRILEEAAGISGLYQRRHEAELKLRGAEGNLARVDDVLEQLASQLSSLARQARQAARYREIGTDLRMAEGILLYRRWREAEDARAAAEIVLRQALTAAAQSESAAMKAAKAREAAEQVLPPLREEEAIASAILQRLQVERDTLIDHENRALQAIETLTARIAQLGNDIARETSLNADAGQSVEALEWEKAQLEKASEGYTDVLANAAGASADAARILADRENGLSQLTEDVARLAARHASAQRLLDDTRRSAERFAAEAGKARSAAHDAELQLSDVVAGHATAETDLAKATDLAARADEILTEAEAARALAQSRESEARVTLAEADGQANTLDAEVRALGKLLDRDRGDHDQVLDIVRVVPGYEAALGAALSDDLKTPLLSDGLATTGWTNLAVYSAVQPLPGGTSALSGYVNAPDALTRRLSQVGVVSASDGPALQSQLLPGQRLVSMAGDLWRWDGYCLAGADSTSTAARRLEQVNQLSEVSAELERATIAADRARTAHIQIGTRLAILSDADRQAREARRAADQQVADTNRAFSRAEADRNILAGKLETLRSAVTRNEEEAAAAQSQMTEAQAAIDDLDDLPTMRGQVEDAKSKVDDARRQMLAKRAAHDDLKREGEARLRRSQQIVTETSGWRHRLETAKTRITELETRKASSEVELGSAQAIPDQITAKRDELSSSITQAESRRRSATDAVAEAETALRATVAAEREAERLASAAREDRARAEARRDSAGETVALSTQRILEAMETTPEKLLADLGADPAAMPPADRVEADVLRLRRQRDALGAVNLRAEEDAREVQEEHDTLETEKLDLDAAIKKLRTGISNLNREGRERLLTAFEDVNRNFAVLFTHLFGGGEAKLVLVESDDPLEAGLEILCQPPGKKLSTLSLLSGGEQTLTALALIFAVFLANPAPICVLDEVDAPLDDANVTRFCDLLDEMTRQTNTRFLIITHHAVTMGRMDRLFGVTMAEQGVSQLVSVDLKKAEQMVA
jgi:chromosome segregation protein